MPHEAPAGHQGVHWEQPKLSQLAVGYELGREVLVHDVSWPEGAMGCKPVCKPHSAGMVFFNVPNEQQRKHLHQQACWNLMQ